MATKQENRLLRILTPLEDDFLLVHHFRAAEGLSQLFMIEAELLHAEEEEGYQPTVVDPQQILGQGISIEVVQSDGTNRMFNGIATRFSQGTRHARFSFYNIEIRPHVWILTQNRQSRIFQHKSVPDILKAVFTGFDVKDETQGSFQPRNYCVQYRESDWDFAARLMEEEGIYYYFEHSAGAHRMILGNTPGSHRDCISKSEIPYFHQVEREDLVTSIHSWSKDHQLQSGKVTFWDHNFELPGNRLDSDQPSRFNIGGNQTLEVYDYPGGYAKKHDGIDAGGAERSGDLQHIFTDKRNVAEVAMQALDAEHETGSGTSDCSSLTAGYKFKMTNHPNSALNGQYIITQIEHSAGQMPAYVSDAPTEPYANSFRALAHGSGAPPFRPKRVTAKPIVTGSQTATVVGPAGEEIFTDKYGRIKVQFHWDRDGEFDAASSCWARVAQSWAGNKWGGVFIPRIGMEVIVDFLEGDPDQPIVTGCVYNPQNMPPYTLPDEKTKSTVKSNSSKGGSGFNEFRFEDKKGSEQIFIHGQKDLDIRIRNNRRELIGNDRHLIVKRDKLEKVERDKHIIIERDVVEKIERDLHRLVEGKIAFETQGSVSHEIGGSLGENVGGSHTEDVGQTFYVNAGMNVVIEAGMQITLKVGGNFVDIGPSGVTIQGTMVLINSGGAAGSASPGTLVPPLEPEEAHIADNADPGSDAPTYRNQQRNIPSRKQPTFKNPTHRPKDPKNKNKKSWIEVVLEDEKGNPVAGERYRVTLPDGATLAEGTTNSEGVARVTNIDPGNCKITFPELDQEAWKPK